jgi:hypothetical protein
MSPPRGPNRARRRSANRIRSASPAVGAAVAQLVTQLLAAFPGLPNARWVAMRLLDGDESLMPAVRDGRTGQLGHGATAANRQPEPTP